MILLKDKMPIFKNMIDLRAYIEQYTKATSIESTAKKAKTSNINTFLLTEFSCFCAENTFFKQYGEAVVQYLDSGAGFSSIYNGILDVFYAPYKTQLLLSALYTSEYLKLHNIFITVPDFLHLDLKNLSITNSQKIGGFTLTDYFVNKPEQPLDIFYNRKTYDTSPYAPPTSEERKTYYDKFFGKKVSRYWDKLFYTTEKDIKCRDTHAVPVFLCDFTADLLYNNIDTGLKNNNIDIFKYLNILDRYPKIKDAKDSTECKNILLKKYKLETIFRPVFIARILQVLTKLEEDFDYHETFHLLTNALECDFIFLYTLLPYLSNTPFELKENALTHQDLLSSFFHHQLKPEDYYINADYLYNHDDMDCFFKTLSSGIQNSQKNFFASLFINLKSLDNVSEAIVNYIVSDFRMEFLADSSYNDTYFNYYIENYGYLYPNLSMSKDNELLQQKQLASAILKKYWGFYNPFASIQLTKNS